MQCQIFFHAAVSPPSLPEKSGDNGNDDADNYHGGNGEVYLQVGPVNDNIPRQASDGQFPEPGPEKSHSQKYYTQDDQRFLHDSMYRSTGKF